MGLHYLTFMGRNWCLYKFLVWVMKIVWMMSVFSMIMMFWIVFKWIIWGWVMFFVISVSIILCESPNKVVISVYYSYIQVDTWRCKWSYIPGTIHMKHCSPRRHSQKSLFILLLFTKTTIHSNAMSEHIDTIHKIHTLHTNIIHDSHHCKHWIIPYSEWY